MNSKNFCLLLPVFLCGPARAAQPVPALSLACAAVSADSLRCTLRVELASGWDINSAKPLDPDLLPASVEVSAEGVAFAAPRFPAPVLEPSAPGGGNLSLYRGTFEIQVAGKGKAKAGPPPAVKATLHYQSCNAGMCYPPKSVDAEWGGGGVTEKLPKKK